MAMNELKSYVGIGPHGKEEECAMFEILDTSVPFLLTDITIISGEYVFSAWVRYSSQAQDTADLAVGGNNITIGSDWLRFVSAFTASSEDVAMNFGSTGTYYIYHPQLELGNKATDWTPNPEDVDSDIQDTEDLAKRAQESADDANTSVSSITMKIDSLSNSVITLVRDEEGNVSGLQQTATGWTFSATEVDPELSAKLAELETKDDAAIDELRGRLVTAEGKQEVLDGYIHINPDDPSITLGDHNAEGSTFKLYITNTFMAFKDGAQTLTTITNKAMQTDNVEVHGDFQMGDEENPKAGGVWIWKQRSNGNMGLVWKGVTS